MWLQLCRRTVFLAALGLLVAPSLAADRILAASPEQAPPQGHDPPGTDDGSTDTPPPVGNDEVIPPPRTGDEGIFTEVPNPDAGHPEEVIPPSGTPDGDPNVDPR